MYGARINEVGKSELANAAQALNIGVVHEVKTQLMLNGDESVDRIVKNFVFVVT